MDGKELHEDLTRKQKMKDFKRFIKPNSGASDLGMWEKHKRDGISTIQFMKQEIQRATSISNIVRLKILAFTPNIEPLSDHFLGP